MPTTLKPNTIYKDKEGWYYHVFAQFGECVFASDARLSVKDVKKANLGCCPTCPCCGTVKVAFR